MRFFQDIRYGLRTLRRVPGLVVIAAVTLALGIGANTAIFSVIYSILIKPLAFPDSDRVVQVWMAFPERDIDRASWSHANFWEAREMVGAFEELGAMEFGDVNLTGMGDPQKLNAVRVNAGFFRVVGVSPIAGRLLREGEDAPSQNPNVVILSHRLWTERFGQDSAIVGRSLVLNGVAHEVIGVLPPGTPYLDWAQLFRPLVKQQNAQRASWEMVGIGRLKPGVTFEAARADLRRVMRILAERHPDPNRGMSGTPGSTGMGIVAAERAGASRQMPWANWRLITADYFKTMGVPLIQGRTFTEQDLIAKPWRVIISQRLADQLWPGENPVGRQALLWGEANRKAEVIGVVGNMRERGLAQPPTLAVYLPAYGSGSDHMFFAIHTTAPTETLVPMLRTSLSVLDPQLPLGTVSTLEEIVTRSTAPRRFAVLLLTAFAGIAMILALVGIFGVTSYSVSRQIPEIGVRLALGATPGRILRLVVVQGMKPVLAGVALGLVAALLLSRLVATLLFEVTPRDPLTYGGVVALLVATAGVACIVPARRAMRVDVATALRAE